MNTLAQVCSLYESVNTLVRVCILLYDGNSVASLGWLCIECETRFSGYLCEGIAPLYN